MMHAARTFTDAKQYTVPRNTEIKEGMYSKKILDHYLKKGMVVKGEPPAKPSREVTEPAKAVGGKGTKGAKKATNNDVPDPIPLQGS